MRTRGILSILAVIILLITFLSACRSAGPGNSALTSISWNKAMSNGNPTLAEFGRGTCVPCKQMQPILKEIAAEYEGRLNVLIISVDDYAVLTRQLGIMAIPTQIFFDKEGKEVTRHVGYFPKSDIIATLKAIGVE